MKKKSIYIILFLILLTGGYVAWQLFGPTISGNTEKYFYIKTGTDYQQVRQSLINKKIISHPFFFDLVSKQIHYPNQVKAGRYLIKKNSSLIGLLRMLRSGNQVPVNLVINKIRLPQDLAQKIAANFECDSAGFMQVLYNPEKLKKYNVDTNNVLTNIIPNSYRIYWNTNPEKILAKLQAEKKKFWTADRIARAKDLNLSTNEVYTIASIVEEETNKEEDKGLIASVYMNRLAKGMKLQADPTVKFALKNFTLTRILHGHLNYNSPFNTYRNAGLPPGPICTPSIKTIDAVLNAPKTNYLFFVAKPDFKGYSNFAATYEQHQIYARAYQQALDQLNKSK